MELVNKWLQSKLPAVIRGARLLPATHPQDARAIYKEAGAQGEICHLTQEDNRRTWILKKFHAAMLPDHAYLVAVRSLVPRKIACMAAAKRVVLSSEDLKIGEGLYSSPDFAKWLQDTVLMPEVPGVSWKTATQEIRSGSREMPLAHRLEFAKSLADAVCALEDNGCAHRDLSQQNLFLDFQEYVVYLVDWDSLFHGSLYFHRNATPGTEGYIAPWTRDKLGNWDSRKSWHRNADRFSLAILLAEMLLVDQSAPSYYEGALFSQEMFFNTRHANLVHAKDTLMKFSESLGELFSKTLAAPYFDECPAPAKWRAALDTVVAEPVPVPESEESPQDQAEQPANENNTVRTVVVPSLVESPSRRLHLWLICFIVLLPLLFWGLYEIRQGNIQWPFLTSSPPEEEPLTPPDIPDVMVQTPHKQGEVLEKRRYLVKIHYSDNDLQVNIDDQQIPLNKDNTAWVTIEKGLHNVSLTFTGTVFPPGAVQRTEPVSVSRKITFDKEEEITIQIDRKEKTWHLNQNKD